MYRLKLSHNSLLEYALLSVTKIYYDVRVRVMKEYARMAPVCHGHVIFYKVHIHLENRVVSRAYIIEVNSVRHSYQGFADFIFSLTSGICDIV